MRHLGVFHPSEKCPPKYVAYGSAVGTVGLILVLFVIFVIVTCSSNTLNQPTKGPLIYTVQEPILSNYSVLCYIEFNTSHVGHNPNQSPRYWTSLFIPYNGFPNTKDTIQITPYDQKGEVSQGGKKSRIVQAYAAYGTIFVNLEYWGEAPWRLHVATLVLEIKPNTRLNVCEFVSFYLSQW